MEATQKMSVQQAARIITQCNDEPVNRMVNALIHKFVERDSKVYTVVATNEQHDKIKKSGQGLIVADIDDIALPDGNQVRLVAYEDMGMEEVTFLKFYRLLAGASEYEEKSIYLVDEKFYQE